MTARTVDSSKDYEPPPSTDEASTMNMGSSNGPVVLQPALFFSLPEPQLLFDEFGFSFDVACKPFVQRRSRGRLLPLDRRDV
jgi:hypothetical protein